MYNVILFSDTPSADWFSRGYGAYRLATELRNNGYSTLVVDFCSALDNTMFQEIIDNAVGDDTLMVGFSVTWFPYRHKNLPNPRYVVGSKSLSINPWEDFDIDIHTWHKESVAYGFSGSNVDYYVDYIKSKNSKIKVVVGGAKSYEYVFEKKLDNIFVGYSENQMMDYINALSGKGPKRLFNKIINYDPKAQVGEFDFNNSFTNYQEEDCLHPEEILTFEFSRGCIFNCTFCSYPHRNQDTRDFLKYQNVIKKELMDNYEKWGVYRYVITDDTFNDYTEKLILIKEVIETLPFKPVFWAYIRLDLISRNPEQAQLIKDIGVQEIYYGLETWHEDTAKIIKKGGSRAKKIEGMRIAKECWGDDVFVMCGTVIGLPHDTVASIKEASEWYVEEGHKYIDLFGHSPFALREFGDAQDYIFQSDIEKNMDKYGYTFPDSENYPLAWVRTGPGDITSKELADELMVTYNTMMSPHWNIHRSFWDLKNLFAEFNIEHGSRVDYFYKFVSEKYFPKLIATLKQTK